METVNRSDVLLLVTLHSLDSDLTRLLTSLPLSAREEGRKREEVQGRTAILAFSFSALISSFFSFFAKSFSNAAFCSTVKLASLSSNAAKNERGEGLIEFASELGRVRRTIGVVLRVEGRVSIL